MNSVISVGCVMMVVVKQSSRHNMWTEITRPKYEREEQRYASDLTDAEWALIAPHMPAAKRLGRPARDRVACRGRCDLVSGADRLPVADAAEGLSSVHDGARLFLRLAGRRLVREDQF